MTRIVAGTVGGRTLLVPGRGTRPTSDRVREALFSRLEHLDVVEGAVVLDLYAGSGALGLEAASRGARRVVLVESAGPAAAVCRRNVAALGLDRVEVVAGRVLPFVERLREPVDLALLDPPYDLAEDGLAEVLAALGPWVAPDGVVVVERSSRSPEPTWPTGAVGGLERTDARRYGESVLWFAERAAADGVASPAPTVSR